jgi:tetratricopeptide (TPR) repeat protein
MTDNPEHTEAAPIAPGAVDRATIGSAKATIATAVISAIAAVAAVAALIISLHSLNVAEEQNTNAQVQALVSLVTAIAQEPSNMAQAAESIKDNPALLNTETAQIELAELGEAEAASSIIGQLPSADVSSVEKYLVGTALEGGDDYNPAITLLTSAAEEASDPRTAANSWRGAADAYAMIGQYSNAEKDIKLAEAAFNTPGVTPASMEYNTAQTEFYDIPIRVNFDCTGALTEWNAAEALITVHSKIVNSTISVDESDARAALVNTCHFSPSLLGQAAS